ncbi:MAG: tetratricopeptide repeat protein [Hormoscilla sp. GUM202]|nr:tetratricopeptide repeat protein [Hormoscilla sp. GUM202]
MVREADKTAENGNLNAADRLRRLAGTLAQRLGIASLQMRRLVVNNLKKTTNRVRQKLAHLKFLMVVLQTVSEDPSPQSVYPLLQQNLDKLDENLQRILEDWAAKTLPQVESEEARYIAGQISDFGRLMRKFPLGDHSRNVEIAIAGNKIALTVYTKEALPQDWARTQHNLGIAYNSRIKGDKAENIEEAIAAYGQALSVWTFEAFPQDWARTQNNLGAAYSDRIKGDKAENIEEAIAAYGQALSVWTFEAFPQDWARTQNNLGAAYSDRIKGDKAENIEEAIAAYGQALSVWTFEAFPQDWARTQNNLGAAYSDRIKGDKAENIEEAIAAYGQALSVWTFEAFPQDWARTQNNLGAAYSDRIKGDKAENIEEAIAAYGQALSVWTFEAFPQDWARTQNNLGAAYSDRIKGDKAENIEEAIAAYGQALSVWTFEAFPQDWARTQNNLGAAYSDRIKGDKAENIEEAIAAYGQALSVWTFEAFPQDWARTQNNLGAAYSDRIKGDKAENIEEAIAAYGQALEVYTPQNFPLDCLRTGRNLGNIGFNNSNWQVAVEGYKLAIAAVEQSRNWAVREERRQEIIKESLGVYINIVQACINLGQLDKAIEYVERSRSQRLIDLMASKDLSHGGKIPPQVQEKLQEYEALQQEINGKRAHQSHDSQGRQKAASGSTAITANSCQGRAAHNAYSEEIAGLEVQKQQVWEELRKLDFELAGQIEVSPPNLATIQQLIASPTAAILSFYTTKNDTHIFILRQNQTPQVHTCAGQGLKNLQLWILANWIQLYVKKDKTEWRHQMNGFLAELAQRLQLDVLISQHLGDIKELILVPHLYLHQIPFAALPINQPREYLIDKFILRTVPSCQILEFCYRRPPIEGSRSYGIVENATEDLPYAAFECSQIVRMYGIPENRRLKGRQGATVENYRQLASRVHVLHSSHHAESRLDNPLESDLKLGNGNITLGELMSPGWRLPDLEEVFLSCCELGPYLNPQNCLLPQNIQASLGQTLVLLAEPVGEVEDYQLLASECVAQLLQKEKPPQLIARGVLCGSQLFEYDTQESDPSKRCHIWVWFGQKESLDLIQQASGDLLNLLCCRHKILYIEYQSRYCNQKARELYSWLEERIKLPQLNDAVTERVEPLKNLLVELPEKQLRYEHFWRDMEDHKTAIATNLDNYRQLLNSIPANEGDDREFLDKFGNLTESKYQRQIEVYLIFLAPGRSLFTQLVATIRGLVEIETQKFLQKQEESDRRLERIIQIWGVGLGVGGIVASSSEHIDKELKESVGIENIHPFAASLSLNVFVTLVVAGIMWWLTRPRHRHKSPDKK